MYQLYYDGRLLYDPREETLAIRDPDTHLAVGEAGNLEFTIDHDHPLAGSLAKLRGMVDLRADARSIFKGRIIRDARDFNLSRRISVEGLLACLNDSIIPPHNFPGDFLGDEGYIQAAESGNVVAFYLGWLLDQHNAQVGTSQRILLGDVTVADPNNYIARASSDYTTTMEAIRGKLENLLGGYLLPDYSGEPTVLHYYKELPLTNTQRVEFGSNLLDLQNEMDASDTYTAILPLGKDDLTLAELPDGEISPGYIKSGKIIYSTEAEEALGGVRVIRREKWDDVTEAANLRGKALDQLSGTGTKLAQTITVKAVDLGVEDASEVSRFVVGRQIEVLSKPHDFSAVYALMELDPDLHDPKNTQITLGNTTKTASGLARSTQLAAQAQLEAQQVTLHAQQEALAQQQQTMSDVPQIIQTQVTAAIQTSESIVYTALERYTETSNFEEFQRTVEQQFSIMAEELVVRFTEATDQTKMVDGDLQRTLETLSKYFEFGLDGLTIRAGENAMELSLDNDLVIFRKNGQQFGWWEA